MEPVKVMNGSVKYCAETGAGSFRTLVTLSKASAQRFGQVPWLMVSEGKEAEASTRWICRKRTKPPNASVCFPCAQANESLNSFTGMRALLGRAPKLTIESKSREPNVGPVAPLNATPARVKP